MAVAMKSYLQANNNFNVAKLRNSFQISMTRSIIQQKSHISIIRFSGEKNQIKLARQRIVPNSSILFVRMVIEAVFFSRLTLETFWLLDFPIIIKGKFSVPSPLAPAKKVRRSLNLFCQIIDPDRSLKPVITCRKGRIHQCSKYH